MNYLSKEVWKAHKSGLIVSNYGRVLIPKSGTQKEHITYGCPSAYGYLRVKRKGITYYVHRLITEAFIPNPNNLPQVNHKDENKQNNSVNNLEWCTPKYNMNYGTRIERMAEKQSKVVLQCDLNGNLIKAWKSTAECGRNGFNFSRIAACCRGEAKTHKGYVWEYK